MVSNKKVLIIFDTNILRSVEDGEVSYSKFEFGSLYTTIEKFVIENALSDFVEFAIPRVVFDELKKQKMNSYFNDINSLSRIYSRLSQIPNVDKQHMKLPNDFNYPPYIEGLAEEYLSNKRIRIIEIPTDETLKEFFLRIIERAFSIKPPFRRSGKHSDTGFKDALIWEAILNYEFIKNFQKIIFVTKDGGFNNECKNEFENKCNRYISIQPSEVFVVSELTSDYEEHIKNRDFVIYANSEYFKSYLEEQISKMRWILINTQKYPISKFEIIDSCESIETTEQEEADVILRIVSSKIKIVFNKESVDSETEVIIRTSIDEEKNISPIDFEPELIHDFINVGN